jgi:hypothetical protein
VNPEQIAADILGSLIKYVGVQWVVRQLVSLFSRDELGAILEAEYKAAELAAELAEKEAFK